MFSLLNTLCHFALSSCSNSSVIDYGSFLILLRFCRLGKLRQVGFSDKLASWLKNLKISSCVLKTSGERLILFTLFCQDRDMLSSALLLSLFYRFLLKTLQS